MQQHQLLIEGIRTPCLDSGGDRREAVLFLHGNPGCGADWAPLANEVAQFARVLAPDMPGFGTAEKPKNFNYSVPGYSAHLAALLVAQGVERVHLVLHDFGGPWGLAWASAHPERVASLTLINIGIMPGYRWHYMAAIWRTPLLGELFQATTTRVIFHLALKHGNPRGLPRAFIDSMFDNYDRDTRRAVLKLYRATNNLGEAASLAHTALRPLDLDCLVIWGKCDPYVPWVYADIQKQTFPRAEVVLLEDSGHWPFIDNPPAVSSALLPFLRRVTAQSKNT